MFTWIKVAIVSAVVVALLGFHLNAIEDAKDEVNKKWQAAELKKDLERKEKEKTILDSALELEREKNAEIKVVTDGSCLKVLDETLKSINAELDKIEARGFKKIEIKCIGDRSIVEITK